jgi:Protein of unknown function (DUF2865)
MTLMPCAPAQAQGFFDLFFGGPQRSRHVPHQANPYSDPNQHGSDRYGERPARAPSSGGGRSLAYCVRLCDGRYFPMPRHAGATSIQLCNAFCPAAKTQVFNGSQIDHATASNGARYADLANAFVYRQRVVADCSCNGKDSFGLARIDVASDPTLRQGDIVASGDNVKAALIAMAAARERGRDAATERPALRGTSPRTATTAPVPPGARVPAETPSEATDDIPED